MYLWQPDGKRKKLFNTQSYGFWATVCKTVRPMLWDRCLSCLSVWNVGVLLSNGWMDQDATWYAGRPPPRRHCVTWGPSSFTGRAQHPPRISVHAYCSQTFADLSNRWALVSCNLCAWWNTEANWAVKLVGLHKFKAFRENVSSTWVEGKPI